MILYCIIFVIIFNKYYSLLVIHRTVYYTGHLYYTGNVIYYTITFICNAVLLQQYFQLRKLRAINTNYAILSIRAK